MSAKPPHSPTGNELDHAPLESSLQVTLTVSWPMQNGRPSSVTFTKGYG